MMVVVAGLVLVLVDMTSSTLFFDCELTTDDVDGVPLLLPLPPLPFRLTLFLVKVCDKVVADDSATLFEEQDDSSNLEIMALTPAVIFLDV
jgi:hypothetical protein